MSDNEIHHPNPATNDEQAEKLDGKIMEKTNVTESPAEPTLLNAIENTSEVSGEVANNLLARDQTDETDRMYRRGRGRPMLKMSKEAVYCFQFCGPLSRRSSNHRSNRGARYFPSMIHAIYLLTGIARRIVNTIMESGSNHIA